jgi:hypothetical protein
MARYRQAEYVEHEHARCRSDQEDGRPRDTGSRGDGVKRDDVYVGMTFEGYCQGCDEWHHYRVTEVLFDKVRSEEIDGSHDGAEREVNIEEIAEDDEQ